MGNEADKQEQIKETGSLDLKGLKGDQGRGRIRLLTIIGEIEGHETLSGNTKATKYEHLLPMLAELEDSDEIDGLLILLNTLGGDIEAGLSIAEMIAVPGSWGKPFDRRASGGRSQIFFYCTKRHDDHPSGALERNVYRRDTESAQYDPHPGPDHPFSGRTFQDLAEQDRRTDAESHGTGQRCGDPSGGQGRGP